MGVIFERPAEGPQSHAIVMGVGGYRHLVGGAQPFRQVIPQIGMLRQLTTAPRSAVQFCKFLMDAGNGLTKPLGSIELLLSTAPDDSKFRTPGGRGFRLPDGSTFDLPQGAAPSDATFGSIQNAYDRWKLRCDLHEDNVAVFYYCGHGVEKKEQYLLAEDFGASPNNAWRGAFAFDSTRLAMYRCRAKTQCFFIDACREITDPMKSHELGVSPLETVDYDATENESTFIMRATAGGETALGPKNGVAYCTQALLRALSGEAAENRGRGWSVRTGIISDRITDILKRVKTDQGFKQRCPCVVTQSAELLYMASPPRVRLDAECLPEEATRRADFECQALNDQSFLPLRQTGGLSADVPAGLYRVDARFRENEFKDAQESIAAQPMMEILRLDCTP